MKKAPFLLTASRLLGLATAVFAVLVSLASCEDDDGRSYSDVKKIEVKSVVVNSLSFDSSHVYVEINHLKAVDPLITHLFQGYLPLNLPLALPGYDHTFTGFDDEDVFQVVFSTCESFNECPTDYDGFAPFNVKELYPDSVYCGGDPSGFEFCVHLGYSY